MTRNEAREHWAASGLGYDVLTSDAIEDLRSRIDAALRASGLIRNYRAAKTAKVWVSAGEMGSWGSPAGQTMRTCSQF